MKNTIIITLSLISISLAAQDIEVQLPDANAILSNEKAIQYTSSQLAGDWLENYNRYNAEMREWQSRIDEVQRIRGLIGIELTTKESEYLAEFGKQVNIVLSKFNWDALYESKQSELDSLIQFRAKISEFCTDWNEGESKYFYSSIVLISSVCDKAINDNGDSFKSDKAIKLQGFGFNQIDDYSFEITDKDFYIKIEAAAFELEKIDGVNSSFIICK